MIKARHLCGALLLAYVTSINADAQTNTPYPYAIVDTGQKHIFSDRDQLKSVPHAGQNYFGQDAQYSTNPPKYKDNGDGTITDLNTGLMWEKQFHANLSLSQALSGASSIRTGGYSDWRLPTIKELYSLIDFNGSIARRDPIPYIDTNYFDFQWGDANNSGNRQIDAQYLSSTQYVGTTMGGQPAVFGVNFADGRIKGYPLRRFNRFVRYVRGNPDYGKNQFVDNNDGTISDKATGLMWTKADSGRSMNWSLALQYASANKTAGYSDWRLPNAKELQSIVDYTRAPDAQDRDMRSAAIDPIFNITNAESYFWTSTTHYDGPSYSFACYVAFGQAMGYFAPPRGSQSKQWMNVHGAGAQRSDPKSGNASRFSGGHGPQGDDIRINNYVRLVRNINPQEVSLVTPNTDTLPPTLLRAQDGGSNGDSNTQGPPPRMGNSDRRPPEGRHLPPPHR